jgi:GNAT superfamily N-acetyltransferase
MSDKLKLALFKIREATIDDVPELAALHVTTFNETHGDFPNGPTYKLRENQWRKAFHEKDESWFCFVIDEDGKLIGFAKGIPHHHDPAFAGELNKIYLLRKYHKIGLGRKLICKVALEFIRRGIFSMLLFGDANNPSNGFYEHMRGEKLFAENGEFHGGYGWRNLHRLADNCSAE